MLIQLCYERPFVTTTDLVEWLNSFSWKASNHHRGFESPKLVSLFFISWGNTFSLCFCFSCDLFSRESFMYMTHVNASILFHSTPRPSRHDIGTTKMRRKLMQQAHWANEIAVDEHEHVVIKLASVSNSSSDTDAVFGLGCFFFGLTARQDYFTHMEPSQSIGGEKTGDPREKNTWPPSSRTWRVSHVTRARLEPTAVRWSSDLES